MTTLPRPWGVELEAASLVEGPAVVQVDPHRMTQVLTNLVGNAIKFSAPGSSVTVSVDRRDDEVRIAVRDRGPGIRPDQLESIFERFRQVPDAAGNRTGTGLGLPIARGIVERSGGRIDVVSEFDAGSTFTVVLPAVQGTPASGGDRP